VARLPAVSAFESQKSRASGISLASVDVVSLDAVTCVNGFCLSGIVANLAERLLVTGSVLVKVSVSVHFIKIRVSFKSLLAVCFIKLYLSQCLEKGFQFFFRIINFQKT